MIWKILIIILIIAYLIYLFFMLRFLKKSFNYYLKIYELKNNNIEDRFKPFEIF